MEKGSIVPIKKEIFHLVQSCGKNQSVAEYKKS